MAFVLPTPVGRCVFVKTIVSLQLGANNPRLVRFLLIFLRSNYSKIVKVIAAFAGAVGKLVSGPGAPPVSCNIPPIVVPPRKPGIYTRRNCFEPPLRC